MNKISKSLKYEELFIFASAKIDPDKSELDRMNDMIPLIRNWDELAKMAIKNGFGPLINKKLPLLSNSYMVPRQVINNFRQSYYKTISRNILLYEHFKRIVTEYQKNNIPVIALKGIYLAEYLYKDIGLRQLSDIDLLIKENDAPKCLSILEEMGYLTSSSLKSAFIEKNSDRHHYRPRILNGVSVEVHKKLHTNFQTYRIESDILWTNAISTTIYKTPVYVLDLNHLLIHLCVHLDNHFTAGKVQLLPFCDITNILMHFKDVINWDTIDNLGEEYNCTGNFFKYIILSNKYFYAPVPLNVLNKYSKMCNEDDEVLFVKYLKREMTVVNSRMNIKLILHNKGFLRKVRFMLHDIFPSRKYMIKRYQIRKNHLVYLYYFYRIFLGFKQAYYYLKTKNERADAERK